MEKIELKTVEEKQAACIFHAIPVTSVGEDMGALLRQIFEWEVKNNLQMAGPPFSIYYSSPEEMQRGELKYEVGIPFVGEARDEGDIKIKTFPAQHVLSTIHKGPYRELGSVYAAVMEHLMKNGYEIAGAPIELYLNNPMDVPESELLTEVQFPVMKR